MFKSSLQITINIHATDSLSNIHHETQESVVSNLTIYWLDRHEWGSIWKGREMEGDKQYRWSIAREE